MFRSFLACASLAIIAGCGPTNPPTATVTGTVTLDGDPVEGATVLFIPDDTSNKAASGQTKEDGTYTLTTFEASDGAQPGTYKVRVHKYDLPEGGHNPYEQGQTADEIPDMTPEEELAAMEQGYTAEAANPDQQEDQAENELPARYDDVNTSGLSFTVEEDTDNNFPIELTSEGA